MSLLLAIGANHFRVCGAFRRVLRPWRRRERGPDAEPCPGRRKFRRRRAPPDHRDVLRSRRLGLAARLDAEDWRNLVRSYLDEASAAVKGLGGHVLKKLGALGERAQEIERGRIGPVQILEGEHDRLVSSASQNPGCHRRQLPAPQLVRREFRPAVLPQRNVDQRRDQRRILGRVEADQRQGVLEVGETPLVGRVGPAKAQSAPFGERVERRVLKELRCGSFDPGVRRLGKS